MNDKQQKDVKTVPSLSASAPATSLGGELVEDAIGTEGADEQYQEVMKSAAAARIATAWSDEADD